MSLYETPAYARAFRAYIRRGTPIAWSLKMEAAEHATTHYIWRTVDDDRVRPEHAANEGKIFSWDAPPPTGHPGEDYNCRCTAEPYIQGESEFAYQDLEEIDENSEQWDTLDFFLHSYVSNGSVITLSQTGNQAGVANYYFFEIFDKDKNNYQKLNAQIIDEARKYPSGDFIYPFKNKYSFQPYIFAFGDSIVGGAFIGKVHHENGMMYINGSVDFYFNDMFTDIADIRELYRGTSDPEATVAIERLITDGGGTHFPIHGSWQTSFRAVAKRDKTQSIYSWPVK